MERAVAEPGLDRPLCASSMCFETVEALRSSCCRSMWLHRALMAREDAVETRDDWAESGGTGRFTWC